MATEDFPEPIPLLSPSPYDKVARPIFYNASHRVKEEREKAFSYVLPLHLYDEEGKVTEWYPPKWGYIPLPDVLKHPLAPKLLFEYCVPLEAAVRIVYEEMWFLQARVVQDWIEFIVGRVIGVIKSTAWLIAQAVIGFTTGGIGSALLHAYRFLMDLLDDYKLNGMFVDATDQMRTRLLQNALIHRYISVEERLLYPERDFKMPAHR